MVKAVINPAPSQDAIDGFKTALDSFIINNGYHIDPSHFGYVSDINESAIDDDTLVVNSISSDNPWPGASTIDVANGTFTYSFSAGGNVNSGGNVGYRWPRYGYITLTDNSTTLNYSIYGFANNAILLLPTQTAPYTQGTGTTIAARTLTETAGSTYRPIILYLDGDASTLTNVSFETYLSAFCFAEGTRIETADGMMAVEDLKEGQLVRTASGDLRPIQWIGETRTRPDLHPRPWEVNPVCVRPHAFGPDMPSREVRFTPGHAVYVDGVLVPVGYLVNGATIVQEAVERIRYFHVELESHDLLLAEGLPCESYLDDGNRASFVNAEGFYELHGRLDPKSWDDACAPLVAAGPQLTEVQQRLHARAEELGWQTTEAADLVIEADGVAVAPMHVADNRYWFAVPAARELRLRSNAAVLAQIVPGLGDNRRLGVAVRELRVNGTVLDLHDTAFGAGFYPPESHEALGWRWTDGAATLALDLAAPAMLEVTLAMVAPSWSRAVPALRRVA